MIKNYRREEEKCTEMCNEVCYFITFFRKKIYQNFVYLRYITMQESFCQHFERLRIGFMMVFL